MKARSPLPKTGKRSRAWVVTRRKVLPLLLDRQDGGCACCRRALPESPAVHHVAGRNGSGLCLGPWADSPDLLVALCRDCHQEVHADPLGQKREQLLWGAVGRLAFRLPRGEVFIPDLSGVEAVRGTVRRLEAAGVEP
jgi:hypothetical protein